MERCDDKLKSVFKKRLRAAMGDMSQRELAKKTGITEVSISRYLSGKRLPRLTELVAIAKTVSVSVDYLLGTFDD